jgi:outer membrane lipoprotein-sorting protein
MFQPESRTVDILAIHDPETCFPQIADPNRLAFPVLFSGGYNLSVLAYESVNGRDAYVIKAINTGDTEYFGEGKDGRVLIWIDREFWLVTMIQAFDSSANLKTSFEVKNFTINSGISDSEFIVTYPEGTQVIHPNQFC